MEQEGTESQADVVVIGSGLGGLTAAAYLAAAGKRVVVVEQHDLAGGNSQVFRRRDCEFDVGIHYIGDCGPTGAVPTVLRGLGLDGRVEFLEMDPEGFDTLVMPDFEFKVPKGWDRYRAHFASQFPAEVEAFDRYVERIRAIVAEVPGLYVGGETPTLDRYADTTLAEVLAECGFSPEAAAVLSHFAGTYGAGPRRASMFTHALLVDHYMRGAYFPKGGGQVLAARLVESIEAHGGEVRTLTRVREIEVEGQRVTGVALEKGGRIAAPVVVSNADLRRTVGELLPAGTDAGPLAQVAAHSTMALGLICLYVVVDFDLTERIANTNYLVFDDYDIDGCFEEAEAGRTGDHVRFAYLSFPSVKDPTNPRVCPAGQGNFQVMTVAPRGYEVFGIDGEPAHGARYRRDGTYRHVKAWYTDQLLAHAERVLGPIRDHVVHTEVATTLSQERYTLSSGGTSYGLAHIPGQSGRRRPDYRTPIDGLYLVGASTRGGHGVAGTMVGGVACAGEVLGRPLVAEVMLGAQLTDGSDLLPPDPDPVAVSRGADLRRRRERRTASAAPTR